MLFYIDSEFCIIWLLNYFKVVFGCGVCVFEVMCGCKVLVVQILGQVFMKCFFDDLFLVIEVVLKVYLLGGLVQVVVVDIYVEVISEKMVIGYWCDGCVSFVVGMYIYVLIVDIMILLCGMGYQLDVGMCGDYDSVIGMDKVELLW